jgi:hypothetical protein
MKVEKKMKIFRSKHHAVRAVNAPKETVTMIDRELQGVIVKLNKSPRSGSQREEILSQINDLKSRRKKAVQPKTYDRMLASLG